jgi:hypothetical protein
MIKLLSTFGLALVLAACTRGKSDRTAGYDPCKQMKEEAARVRSLEEQLKALEVRSRAISRQAPSDTVEKVTVESLIVQKEDILASATHNMQESAEACDAQSRSFDRYRTPSEREEGL